eukprot:11553278-Heterocapsa_arctica.AAC.1
MFFALAIFEAVQRVVARGCRVFALLEQPEDLGSLNHAGGVDSPGTMWQLPRTRALLNGPGGFFWGALFQGQFGTDYPKPT